MVLIVGCIWVGFDVVIGVVFCVLIFFGGFVEVLVGLVMMSFVKFEVFWFWEVGFLRCWFVLELLVMVVMVDCL